VSSSEDRTLKRWDVRTGKELPKETGHQANFQGLINPAPYIVVTADGKRLLAWVPLNERNTTITVFNLASDVEQLSFNDTGPKDPFRHVLSMSFTPDGKRVAAGAKDGSVRIFDLTNKGQKIGDDWAIFPKGTVLGDIAFTPDGNTLIVGNEAGDIKIGDVG